MRADKHGILPEGPVGTANTSSFMAAWDFMGDEIAQTRNKLEIK